MFIVLFSFLFGGKWIEGMVRGRIAMLRLVMLFYDFGVMGYRKRWLMRLIFSYRIVKVIEFECRS